MAETSHSDTMEREDKGCLLYGKHNSKVTTKDRGVLDEMVTYYFFSFPLIRMIFPFVNILLEVLFIYLFIFGVYIRMYVFVTFF